MKIADVYRKIRATGPKPSRLVIEISASTDMATLAEELNSLLRQGREARAQAPELFGVVLKGQLVTSGGRIITGSRADVTQMFGNLGDAEVVGLPRAIEPVAFVREEFPEAFRRPTVSGVRA